MADDDAGMDELIRRARDGDDDAANRLWEIARSRLILGGDRSMDASDVVQETLLYAARTLGRFRGSTEAELMAWLRGIRGHIAIDEHRRKAAQKRGGGRAPQSLEESPVGGPARKGRLLGGDSSPSQRAMRAEWLARAIDRLPELPRSVLRMYYLEGRTLEEVAGRLCLTTGETALLYDRGIKTLRSLLRPEEEETTDGRGGRR